MHLQSSSGKREEFVSAPRISIVGFGYVGLTTAVCFASRGLFVRGFDVDNAKVSEINNGVVPFHEPQVSDLLKDSLKTGFTASSDKIELGDIIFITVGTPSASDGSIDLMYIKSASEMIGKALKNSRGYRLIIVKSTVVPGTTEGVVKPIIESSSGKKVGDGFGLAVNPEFLREGSAVKDMYEPDRLVIGEYDRRSGDVLESFYKIFYQDKMPSLLRTNLVNAEFIKYANNAFLATKISFANTIANIAQRVPGADVTVIAKGIGLDNRIGSRFLNAGLGYGGSCFPKDVKALISLAKTVGYNPLLLEDVEDVNLRQFEIAVAQAKSAIGGFLGKTVTLLGLAFKPETDDVREAVSARMINRLLLEGAQIRAYDPIATKNMARMFPTGKDSNIVYADSALEALQGSDCCFVVTEWSEFMNLKPEDYLRCMRTPVLIDGRRIYDPQKFIGKVKIFLAIGLGTHDDDIPTYSTNAWRNPSLAVNAILTDSTGRVFLVRRNKQPFKGELSLPGGFVDYDESAEQALNRELREELGIEVSHSKLIRVYSDPVRSPDKHVVALLYQVIYDGTPNISDRHELIEGAFYDPRMLSEKLAFDHSKMLQDFLAVGHSSQ